MRADKRVSWRLIALILIFVAMIAFLLPFVDIYLEGNKVSDLNINSEKTFSRSYSGFKLMFGTDDKVTGINPKDGSTRVLKPKIPVKRDGYLIISFLAACAFIIYCTVKSKYRPYILGALSLGGAGMILLHYINTSTSLLPTVAELVGQRKMDNIFTLDALAQATKVNIYASPGIGVYIAGAALLLAAVLCFTGRETERSLRPILNFDNYGYYFIVPFVIVYSLFSLYPIIYSFYISLTDMQMMRTDGKDTSFIGLANYIEFLSNKNGALDQFFKSFKITWTIWLWNFFPQLGLAILLAVWFTDMRLKLRFTGMFKTLYYLPNVITQASVAVLFNALFNGTGPVNLLLVKTFDLIPERYDFLISQQWTRGIVSFIQTWLWYGNTLILIIAGMLGISPTYYEAAMVDGANSGQMFLHVTLPNLRPLLKYVLVTSLIGGMQIFDVPFMLIAFGSADNALTTMTMHLYGKGFRGNNDYGRAAVIAVAMFLVILFCNVVLNYILTDRRDRIASRRRVKA
jgi:multiple sugar transport system permease protein